MYSPAPRWLVLLAFVGTFLLVGGRRWLTGEWFPTGWRRYLLAVAVLLLLQFLVTAY